MTRKNIMNYKNILITGGTGFVGSNTAIKLKENYANINVVVLDNLKRRGSELNLPRLKQYGIEFIHGDIRNKEDLKIQNDIDLIIECSAEPSALAGVYDSPEYVINTNLVGTLNCLEIARLHRADMIFLSTSRVYPMKELHDIAYEESATRFILKKNQRIHGVLEKGINEEFPLGKTRSLYGATKLASEFMLQEYIETYKIRGIINRCGVITGPWQMGKVDQGVITLWLARHIWKNKSLSYIGYNGEGKQVRDFIHIDDFFDVIKIQLESFDSHNTEVYNIGGGVAQNLSLQEMTKLCQEITGNKIPIKKDPQNRPNDIRIYISDCSKFQKKTGWNGKKNAKKTFHDIYTWIIENKKILEPILSV